MPKKLRKSNTCYNCHKEIGDANYCPNCGQMNSHRQIHLVQLIKELMGDYFTFDSKFFKSIWPLISRPGFLTVEYISGRRAKYIFPLRLYIFTTFLFFLMLSLISTIDPYGTNNPQLYVNTDSLKTFLQSYKESIPVATRERLSYELNRNYSMVKKSVKRKGSTIPDTLKKYLLISKPALNDTLATVYADELYMSFAYYGKREGTTAPSDSLNMQNLLSKFNFNDSNKYVFRSWLDSTYYLKKVVYKNRGVNITIAGTDTAASGFLRKVEKKAEHLFSQGSRGWSIFWNELIRQIPKIMFFLLPLFALLLKLFYIRQKIFYINHLIFALHVHSLIFIYLIIAILIPNGWIIGISVFAIWLHTYLSFKNVYRQSYLMTFLKFSGLLILYNFVLVFSFVGLSIFTVWIT